MTESKRRTLKRVFTEMSVADVVFLSAVAAFWVFVMRVPVPWTSLLFVSWIGGRYVRYRSGR